MENHHFSWENSLKMAIFNSYVKLPEGICSCFSICRWPWIEISPLTNQDGDILTSVAYSLTSPYTVMVGKHFRFGWWYHPDHVWCHYDARSNPMCLIILKPNTDTYKIPNAHTESYIDCIILYIYFANLCYILLVEPCFCDCNICNTYRWSLLGFA
jgi:hypothetical protein